MGTSRQVPWAPPSPAPDGSQYLFANTDSFTISQASDETATPGRRYVLTVQFTRWRKGRTARLVMDAGDWPERAGSR